MFLDRNEALTQVVLNWTDSDAEVSIESEHFFRDLMLADITVYVSSGNESIYELATLCGDFPDASIV